MEQRIGQQSLRVRLLAWAGGLITVLLFFLSAATAILPTPGELNRAWDAQLGSLRGEVTAGERRDAARLLLRLLPLQNLRRELGIYGYIGPEEDLLWELNGLYEAYTERYCGPLEDWGYGCPEERTLARFEIDPEDYTLTPAAYGRRRKDETADLTQLQAYGEIWARMCEILPEDAFARFSSFLIWTDGPDETLAYVQCLDEEGYDWEIAVDPADVWDEEEFVETILHEYTHYLTLNGDQVQYTKRQTTDTYNEWGMVSREDSYLNQYYQRFWRYILDDCLIHPGSYGFYLRHREEFVSAYASSDPVEDICESFAAFVLADRPTGDSVVERKLLFFYEFEELVAIREAVRENLALSQGGGLVNLR